MFGVFRCLADPGTGRSEATEDAAAIEEAEIASAEADDMVAVFVLGQGGTRDPDQSSVASSQ